MPVVCICGMCPAIGITNTFAFFILFVAGMTFAFGRWYGWV